MARRISDMSDDFIRWSVDEYLKFSATMDTVAEIFDTTREIISKALFKAVAENIVDDITANAVAAKAISFTKNFIKTRDRWNEAKAMRKDPSYQLKVKKRKISEFYSKIQYLQEIIEDLNPKIEQIKFQVETYTDFFLNDINAPTRDELEDQITDLERDVSKCKNAIGKYNEKISKLKTEIAKG